VVRKRGRWKDFAFSKDVPAEGDEGGEDPEPGAESS